MWVLGFRYDACWVDCGVNCVFVAGGWDFDSLEFVCLVWVVLNSCCGRRSC